jgi:hypothetical protein
MKTILLAVALAAAAFWFGWVNVDVDVNTTVNPHAIKSDLRKAEDKARAVGAALKTEAVR